MNRSVSVAVVLLALNVVPAHPLPANSGIVTSNHVRLRLGPSITDGIKKELFLGTIAAILDVSTGRDRIDQSREFSYSWFHVKLPEGAEGWVYGRYFYPLEREDPAAVTIRGERYHLAVFREDGFLNDMPSQDQYALPCLIREKDGRASAISISAQVYRLLPNYSEPSGRDVPLPETTFLLVGNTGTSERATSVRTGRQGRSEVLRLKVDFSLQVGGGTYTLVLYPPARAGEPFAAVDVEDVAVQIGS